MRILQRYLLWEMTVNFLGVTLVALALLLVNQVGSVLARAAQLQYQKGFVLELIALSAAQNVAILLPFGLVIGIVLAFGRLYHDSEMAAAQACDLRSPLRPSAATAAAVRCVRSVIAHLGDDRWLKPDVDAAIELVSSGALVGAVESEIGVLR